MKKLRKRFFVLLVLLPGIVLANSIPRSEYPRLEMGWNLYSSL